MWVGTLSIKINNNINRETLIKLSRSSARWGWFEASGAFTRAALVIELSMEF